jgi:hypothetical protein
MIRRVSTMISIDLMREYVHSADALAEAQAEIRKWEAAAAKARAHMEDAAAKMNGGESVEVEPPPLTVMPEGISTAEIQQRTLRANKKIRGEATLAILKALPGTLPEITQRTGLKKTTVSTLVSRLQTDGLVKKDGETLMPGYEHRTATVYGLAV